MLTFLQNRMAKVINHFSYTVKFVLLSLLFFGVLASPLYELSNYVGGSNSFTEKEIVGLKYITPLKQLLFDLNVNPSELAGSADAFWSTLDKDWQAVQASEKSRSSVLLTEKPYRELQAAYEAFKTQHKNDLKSPAAFTAMDQLATKIIALISAAGTNSNLVLDPDTDAYYVMDTIVYRLPPLAQYLSQYQEHANTLLQKGRMSLQDEEKLIELKTHLVDTLNLTKGNLDTTLASTKDKGAQPEMAGRFQTYANAVQTYIEYVHQGLSTPEFNTGAAVNFNLSSAKTNELSVHASKQAASLYDAGSNVMLRFLQKRIERTNEPWYRTLIISSLVLVFIVYFMSSFRLAVIQTVKGLERATRRLAEGDLTTRVELETRDELRQVGVAFNQMATAFCSLISEVKENAQDVTTASESLSSISQQMKQEAASMSQLSENASHLTESVDNSIKTVAAAVEQSSANINEVSRASTKMGNNIESVHVSAQDVSHRMQLIADAAEEMSSSVNTVASAIEEMSASLNEVSMSAAHAAKVANIAEETAQTTSETVNALGGSAREIESVLGVIKDIASQTNLLALNATIEAASAGEAGKGFAVVANEVKELAKRSAEATEDIRTRIEKMQSNTNAAVDAIGQILTIISEISHINHTIASAVEEQTATVNEVTRSIAGAAEAANEVSLNVNEAAKTSSDVAVQVSEANQSVTLITTHMTELAQGANEISKGAGEAATGASEMAEKVSQVNETSHATDEGASNVQLTAEELSKLASDLKLVVERFKIAV